MYNQLQEYTSYIKTASAHPSKSLAAYHAEMLHNFQHERLVHLIITLFFVFISLLLIALSATLFFVFPATSVLYLLPLFIITLTLTTLSVAYIVHYYHLENGVQNLYQYSEKLNLNH
jgi:ABC-type bacteriocin/lantibiotic exporter with double-glycine peptidase domain